MKIFGTTDVQGLIKATTGSFFKQILRQPQADPNVFVAGTDATYNDSLPGNRSIIGQGGFDYVISSNQNGDNGFTQAKVPGGRVLGYRVQHVDYKTAYTLVTELNPFAKISGSAVINSSAPDDNACRISVSVDGGLNFSLLKGFGDFVGFDMIWINKSECYVVGAKYEGVPGGNAAIFRSMIKFQHLLGGRGKTFRVESALGSVYRPALIKIVVDPNKTPTPVVISTTEITLTGALAGNPNDALTAIAYNPTTGVFIYGSESGKLYKDDGGTITDVTGGGVKYGVINRVIFDKYNATTAYAATSLPYGKVLKTTDDGDNWTAVALPVTRLNGGVNDIIIPEQDLVLAVTDDTTKILRSSDAGANWSFISTPIPNPQPPIIDIKTLKLSPSASPSNIHVAISSNNVFWSVGQTYDLSGTSPNQKYNWTDLKQDKFINIPATQQPKALDVVEDTGIAYSFILLQKDNKTATISELEPQTDGFNYDNFYNMSYNNYNLDFNAISARSAYEIYVTADGGVTNGGYIFKGERANLKYGTSAQAFTFTQDDSSSKRYLDVKCTDTKVFACGTNNLLKYKTYGGSWTILSVVANHDILKVWPVNDNYIVVLTQDTVSPDDYYIYVSDDGGSTWTQKRQCFYKPIDIHVYSTDTLYVLHENGYSIEFTIDFTQSTPSFTVVEISSTTIPFQYGNRAITIDETKPHGDADGFLITAGTQGIILSNLQESSIIGPWPTDPQVLAAIAGEGSYRYWIGGGTTGLYAALGTDLGSEPILMSSDDKGLTWVDKKPTILNQEPAAGDYLITALSEGSYIIYKDIDKFYIYGSSNNGTSFGLKSDSEFFVDNNKYQNGTDGILKMRFLNSSTGFAVGTVKPTALTPSTRKLSYTSDGGSNWSTLATPQNFNITSVFFTSANTGFITAYPINSSGGPNYNSNSTIFKTTDGGTTWNESLNLPVGKQNKPLDIFFIDANIGIVTLYGNSSVEGIYRTTNGGTSWSFVSITGYRGGNTKQSFMDDKSGQIQFVSTTRGFISGKNSSSNPGLFTTTDAGATWSRVTTPINSNTGGANIDTVHFLDKTGQTGVFSFNNTIYRTTNGGANASLVYTVPNSTDASTAIADIKFSSGNTIGVAVGSRNLGSYNDHFVLLSTNGGSSWREIDSNHTSIDLENSINPANSAQRDSILYTTAFAEPLNLSDEEDNTNGGGGEDTKDCFQTRFISSSFYNLENFAYRCTKPGETPVYVPNSSENVGLGVGIFGQKTSQQRTLLRDNLTQGAAVGVGTLGNSTYSNKDTAVGHSAMGTVINAKENVAVGYGALQTNKTILPVSIRQKYQSNIIGVSPIGQLFKSVDGGFSWNTVIESGSSFTSASFVNSFLTGSNVYLKPASIVSPNSDTTFILYNDFNISSSLSLNTYILRSSNKNSSFTTIYSSSVYTIDKIIPLNSNIVYGIDSSNSKVLRSTTSAKSWVTCSINGIGGNSIKNLSVTSINTGFLVGSKIWYIQSGSNLNWVTSSYTGSHIINAIDSINSDSWIAVGESGSIYKTNNTGVSWSLVTQSLTTESLNDVKVLKNGNVLTVGNSGTILISSTTGSTWYTGSYDGGSDFSEFDYTTIQTYSPSILILASAYGNVRSDNSGNTWYLAANTANGSNSDILLSSAVEMGLTDTQPKKVLNPLGISAAPTPPIEYIAENVAVGAYSVGNYTNSWGVVGVGARSLETSTPLEQSVVPNMGVFTLNISSTSGLYDFINDVGMPPRPSNYGQVAIGRLSQGKGLYSQFNTSVGYGSLYLSQDSVQNTAVGFYSQHLSSNTGRNTSLGVWALGVNGPLGNLDPYGNGLDGTVGSYAGGSDNVAIGYKAMLYNTDSKRAAQLIRAGFGDASQGFSRIGSVNVAIGNRALNHASGSTNTVAIGHQAVIDSYDLTDSIFIGGYVGYRFKTLIGSYYSSSVDNDWTPTQTVAVGSYALLNHTGTDLVAIGANALRGISVGAFPNETGNPNSGGTNGTTRVHPGVIVVGTNLSTFSQLDPIADAGKSHPPRLDNWVKDSLGNKASSDTYGVKNTFTRFYDIDIVDDTIAYAVAATVPTDPYYEEVPDSCVLCDNKTYLFSTAEKLFFRVLKAENVSSGNPLEWKPIAHIGMPGTNRHNKRVEGIVHRSNRSGAPADIKIQAPSKNVIYVLNDENGKHSSVFKSIDGGYSFHGDGVPDPMEARIQVGENSRVVDMHFTSENNGTVIGSKRDIGISFPIYVNTYNGGTTWSDGYISTTVSGSALSVWFNNQHGVGYVGLSNSSIFKTTNSGSAWSLILSHTSSLWDDVIDRGSNYLRTSLAITSIFFLNDSIGWATANAGGGYGFRKVYVLRTTDGGVTWDKTEFTHRCVQSNTYGVPPALKVRAIDENTVLVATGYGSCAISTDGGVTFKTTTTLPLLVDPTSRNSECCPAASPITILDVLPNSTGGDVVTPDTSDTVATAIRSVAVGSDIQVKQTLVAGNVSAGYKVQFNASGSAVDSVQIGAYNTYNANDVDDTVSVGNSSLYLTKKSDKTTAIGSETLYILQQSSIPVVFPGGVVNGKNKIIDELLTTKSGYNTAVGYQAASGLYLGDRNVYLGANAGNNQFQMGSNNVLLGANSVKTVFNMTNQVVIGNPDHTTHVVMGIPGVNGWIWQSDGRDKTETGSFDLGLSFIREIQPKEYKWDPRHKYGSGSSPNGTHKQSGSSYGYIAQDLEAAATAVGVSGSLFVFEGSGSYSGSSDTSGSDFGVKMITPAMINLVAINAIKELDTLVAYLSSSKYTTNIGDSTNSTFSVTHSLATRDVVAMIYSNLTEQVVYPSMSIDTINHIQVAFPTPPGINEYRIVVMR